MDEMLRYFRDRANVARQDATFGATAVQVLDPDPMRYQFTMWNDPTVDVVVWFDAPGVSNTASIRIPPGNGPVVFSEDNIGELVRYPVYLQSIAGGGLNVTLTTVSYSPQKYEEMKAYVNAKLSIVRSL